MRKNLTLIVLMMGILVGLTMVVSAQITGKVFSQEVCNTACGKYGGTVSGNSCSCNSIDIPKDEMGTKTSISKTTASKKSSGPRGYTATMASDGVTTCYFKDSQATGKATGRFLGFMFRD